jgi:homoserine O-acetyltransferase
MKKYEKFNIGNIKLLSGKILKSTQLVYKTYGKLNKDCSNVIILPTFYTGTHVRNEGFIGKNRALNPNKYFIISINMFGNGLSSSPSNATKTQNSSKFPKITLWDNIYCQHKLITEKLKIKNIILKKGNGVNGWEEKILFDAIIVSAASEKIPPKLLQNLKKSGKLIIPKKYPMENQKLILIKKTGENSFDQKELFDVKFVPLLNDSVQHLI